VNPPSDHSPADRPGLDPVILGTACCILAAVGYSSVNVCLRDLANKVDQTWILFVKESVAVAVVGPWLAWLIWRRRQHVPRWRSLGVLALVGLATQLIGNLPAIWAIGTVGLAISIPTALGVNLVASAIFGRIFLGERVSHRSVAAIALLTISVVLLSLGANDANRAMAGSGATSGSLWAALAVGASALAGTTYAGLAVVIRKTTTNGVAPLIVILTVTGMGVLSMGVLSATRLGLDGMAETSSRDLGWMLASGVFNLIAFMAITKGLQLTTVVHANVINASQTALCVVAGFLFFGEHASSLLVTGIALTIVGMVLNNRQGNGNGRPATDPITPD